MQQHNLHLMKMHERRLGLRNVCTTNKSTLLPKTKKVKARRGHFLMQTTLCCFSSNLQHIAALFNSAGCKSNKAGRGVVSLHENVLNKSALGQIDIVLCV